MKNSLKHNEHAKFEELFDMKTGYVLSYNNSSFASLFATVLDVSIYDEKYATNGDSKAKRLRAFWDSESDGDIGMILSAMLEYHEDLLRQKNEKLFNECNAIVQRLLSGAPILAPLKDMAVVFDAPHLAEQIRRIEASTEKDPSLAIGTAKELIETCCRTILEKRGKVIQANPTVQQLVKETLKELELVPDKVKDSKRGADSIRQILQVLGTIGQAIGELRNLYGTGHGKNGNAIGLTARHARLAVGAASTLVRFLFDTYTEQARKENQV